VLGMAWAATCLGSSPGRSPPAPAVPWQQLLPAGGFFGSRRLARSPKHPSGAGCGAMDPLLQSLGLEQSRPLESQARQAILCMVLSQRALNSLHLVWALGKNLDFLAPKGVPTGSQCLLWHSHQRFPWTGH